MSEKLTDNEKLMAEIIALHIVRERNLCDMIQKFIDTWNNIDPELINEAKELIEK